MDKIIKVETMNEGSAVSARELHKFLESKQQFADWIKNRIEKFSFKEGVDFYRKYYDVYGNEVDREYYNINKIEYFLTKESGKLILLSENKEKSLIFRNKVIENEDMSTKILSKFSEMEYSLSLENLFIRNDKVFISLENLSKLVNEPIETLRSKLDEVKYKLSEENIIVSEGSIELDEFSTLLILNNLPLDVYCLYLEKYLILKESLIKIYKQNVVDNLLPEYKGEIRYVYIIQNTFTHNIKIGISTNPSERLSYLQTGSDVELKLIYKSGVCSNFFEIESLCHEKFKDYNVRGEWFNVDSSEVISFLENQKFVLTSNLL